MTNGRDVHAALQDIIDHSDGADYVCHVRHRGAHTDCPHRLALVKTGTAGLYSVRAFTPDHYNEHEAAQALADAIA